MKILLINDYATPAYGSEKLTLDLRDLLRLRGHDARLFASCVGAVKHQEILANYKCLGTSTRFGRVLSTANPWAYWKLRRVLLEFRPDVVHVRIFLSQLSPLILPVLRKVPSLYHIVVYNPICPTGLKLFQYGSICQVSEGINCYRKGCFPLHSLLPNMLKLTLFNRWCNAFNLLTTNSYAMRSALINGGIDVADVVWNAVLTRPRRPPLSAPPTVVFAGRLVREKGADVLLKAFARTSQEIKDARLILSGDGIQRKRLERLIVDLGISNSVFMTGHIPMDEMEKLFDSSWVQVVPSLWGEPFGRAAAEAMMRGTAVIASDSGGLAEIVGRDHQRGFLVPPGDEEALAEALSSLLLNRQLAEKMGRAGREFALVHFNQESYMDKILQLYNRICPGAS